MCTIFKHMITNDMIRTVRNIDKYATMAGDISSPALGPSSKVSSHGSFQGDIFILNYKLSLRKSVKTFNLQFISHYYCLLKNSKVTKLLEIVALVNTTNIDQVLYHNII